MKICSLLPSATEILFAIGLGNQVVAVTHECDYPSEARSKPVITRCAFDSEHMSPAEIDDAVRALASEGKSLYTIDEELLHDLAPDLIVTQDLCHVCAITPGEVDRAIKSLPHKPRIISLSPKILDDVFNDMLEVGRVAGVDSLPVIRNIQSRVRRIAPAATLPVQPSVACIEWLDPLWRSGHWVPGMVQLAGGRELLAEVGKPSRPVDWDELLAKNPDIVIFMPCGYDLMRTREEFERVRNRFAWQDLKAFRSQQLYIVDANSYFSRSGPRLVEGVELLAEILHPEYFTHIAPLHSYIRVA
jgi:iron complex transport system substrate-binding protein